MVLKYTTVEAIERRLDGRIKFDGYQEDFGGTTICSDLVEQIGQQIEAKVNEVLGRRWVMPLKWMPTELQSTHPQLSMLVESGVVCQILSQYYLDQMPSEQGGNTPSICKIYFNELKVLQTIMLEGETLIQPSNHTAYGRPFSGQAVAERNVSQAVQDVRW